MREIEILKQIALKEREILMQKYGNTFGKCIEATDNIVEYLLKVEPKLKPEAKQVWVLYENFEGCTDICYEEHWLAKVLVKGYPYYIDVTMDQFQWAFYKKLPEIYFDRKLPNFYLVREPGKATLSKCGWTDWYNTGDYVNNFNYYD